MWQDDPGCVEINPVVRVTDWTDAIIYDSKFSNVSEAIATAEQKAAERIKYYPSGWKQILKLRWDATREYRITFRKMLLVSWNWLLKYVAPPIVVIAAAIAVYEFLKG